MPPTMGRRVNLLILRRQSRCAGQDMSDRRTGPDSNAARCRMGGLNEKGNSADLPKQGASLRPTRRAHPTTKGHGTPEGKPARTVARVGATIRHGLVFFGQTPARRDHGYSRMGLSGLPPTLAGLGGWGFQAQPRSRMRHRHVCTCVSVSSTAVDETRLAVAQNQEE